MTNAPTKRKGGRPSKHPELGNAVGTAHVYVYEGDWKAYYMDIRQRGLTTKQLSFSSWIMEGCRNEYARRLSQGALVSCLDRTLIDIYGRRAEERLRQDFEIYRTRQLAWIKANIDGLHKHWPDLEPEEIFDELEAYLHLEDSV